MSSTLHLHYALQVWNRKGYGLGRASSEAISKTTCNPSALDPAFSTCAPCSPTPWLAVCHLCAFACLQWHASFCGVRVVSVLAVEVAGKGVDLLCHPPVCMDCAHQT